MIPAVGQGMLACECRESDEEIRALLDRITPAANYLRYQIEREILGTSEGALKASYHHAVKKIEQYLEERE